VESAQTSGSSQKEKVAEVKPESKGEKGKSGDTPVHQSLDAFELPEVNVVGNTPIGTVGLDPKKSPVTFRRMKMRRSIGTSRSFFQTS